MVFGADLRINGVRMLQVNHRESHFFYSIPLAHLRDVLLDLSVATETTDAEVRDAVTCFSAFCDLTHWGGCLGCIK